MGVHEHLSPLRQEPRDSNGEDQDCAYMDKDRYYYLDDGDCEAEKSVICERPSWKTLQKDSTRIQTDEKMLQEFLQMSTKEHDNDCVRGNRDEISHGSGNERRAGRRQQQGASGAKTYGAKERQSGEEPVRRRSRKRVHTQRKTAKDVLQARREEKVQAVRHHGRERLIREHYVERVQAQNPHLLRLEAENQHA